jgi:hypothetical protein
MSEKELDALGESLTQSIDEFFAKYDWDNVISKLLEGK